jgi:hypothetical protein
MDALGAGEVSMNAADEVSRFASADLRPAIFGSIGIVAGAAFMVEVVRSFSRPVRVEPRLWILGLVGVISTTAFVLLAWGAWSSFRDPFVVGGGSRYRWHGWARGLMFSAGTLIAWAFALAPLANWYARRRHGVAGHAKSARQRKGDLS